MRALIAVAGLLVAAAAVAAVSVSSAQAGPARASAGEISGAGATFPAPLIAVWQQRYEAAKGVKVNYNPIGSGGGIAAITQKTVDFGASDAPLSPDQFTACNGCVQLPWVLSATSVMYNMPLPNNLHMTGPILADIYLGKITNWNDARIKKINKGVSSARQEDHRRLPQRRQRHDLQLHHVPEHGQQAVEVAGRRGHDASTGRPASAPAEAPASPASSPARRARSATRTSRTRSRTRSSSSRCRTGPASSRGRACVGIRAASLADRKFSPTNELSIVNPPPGKKFRKAYPICTYSYVLLRTQSEKANLLKPFVTWALTTGQQYGPHLVFQPVPAYVVARGKATLKKVHS